MSGILTSSLWQVNGSELTYAGSVSAQGRITQDKNGVHHDFEPAVTTTTPPSASAQRFSLPTLQVPTTSKIALPAGAQVSWRTQLKSPRVYLTTADGKRVSMQRVSDPRGGGRPPVATMLYNGDKPVSLIEAHYEKEGKRWKPTRSRITLFGKDGKPSAVTESNFAALHTASVAMPGTAAVLSDGFRRVGGTLSKLIQPDALYAATGTDDGERCWPERLAVAAAAAAQVGADIGLAIAIATCGAFILTCPAVAAAVLAVTATAVNYLLKIIAYDECMSRTLDPVILPADGSNGGSEGGDGCYDIVWEISYDGGWTWNYYGTQRVCDRAYAM